MNNNRIRQRLTAFKRTVMLSALAAISACSTDSDSYKPVGSSSSSSGSMGTSFKADISDFAGYQDWKVVDYAIGASNPLIGGAHGAGADALTRKTFMNATAANSVGEYEQGSILIKEVFTYRLGDNGMNKTLLEQGGVVAMVKRNGGFNPDNNGWEWFMLESDLSSVADQGDNLLGGACNGCHSKAETQMGGLDYVFPKPTEVIAQASDFADYTQWDLIEFDSQPGNLSGGAHIDDANQRRVFQKQRLANPDDAGDMGYPVGTMLVKDISKDDEIKQIVAMIKRGGAFNSEGGDWEFFMLDANDPSTIATDDSGTQIRGAIPMCISCHVKATGEMGIDFVFKHKDAPFNTNTAGEFVASKANLENYSTWPLTDYALGASNPFIGMAHSGSKPEFARAVYQNAKAAMLSSDEYPVGSILVKETFTTNAGEKQFADAGGLLAMVKRGGTYNPDHMGWEWLMMSAEGNLMARGSDLMGGACNACHSKADGDTGVDYSFAKPSEHIASLADFIDYASWTQIGEVTGDSAANGGAHPTDSTRKTYKKQGTASPYFESGEYPVGTTIVKEIITDGSLSRLYGMVKRGGNFNPDNGDWQWFLINTDLSDVTDLGVGSGCTGCHSKAGTENETDASFMGTDYVFYHSDDPVPMPVMAM